MDKTLSSLLPMAIGLVVFGVANWLLLSRNLGLGRWLLAAFLVGHGLVQAMFLAPRPPDTAAATNGVDYPFDLARSWLVTGVGLDLGLARALGMALIAVVVIGYGLAGLATVGLLVPAAWWPGLVGGTTAVSVALLALFFSPGLILGLAINAVLLWLVWASGWTPTAELAARVGAG